MTWRKARKKPVVVEFREINGESEVVETLHGPVQANKHSDYVVKTVRGDVYPCDKLLFHETHDVLDANVELTPFMQKVYRLLQDELTPNDIAQRLYPKECQTRFPPWVNRALFALEEQGLIGHLERNEHLEKEEQFGTGDPQQ